MGVWQPSPCCQPSSRKRSRKQRSTFLVFSCICLENFPCFHGVLQCQIYDGIRRQKEEAQMPQIPQCVSGEDANRDVKTTKKPYTLYRQLHGTQPVFFPHRGGFKGMVAQFRLVDFMCIVYMPRTQLTSIFEGTQPSKTRPFSSIKTRGPIWVLILFPMFSTAKLLVLDKWWASLECLWIIWPEGWSSGVKPYLGNL